MPYFVADRTTLSQRVRFGSFANRHIHHFTSTITSEVDYTEAAAVAAYYSKATGDLVAVDYTKVKNIKKPQGSKPGFVTYKTNYTAYVRPMSGEELGDNGDG